MRTHLLWPWPGSSPGCLNCTASHLQKGPGPQELVCAPSRPVHPLPWASRREWVPRGHHTPSQAQRPPSVPQRTWLICFCTSDSLVGLFYPNPVSPCRPGAHSPCVSVAQSGYSGRLCGVPSFSEGELSRQPAVHQASRLEGADNRSVWALDPQAQKGEGARLQG